MSPSVNRTSTPAGTPPRGTRWKGGRRTVVGWVLVVLGVLAVLSGITGDHTGESPLPGGLMFIAIGAGLVSWGRRLKAQRIPVPIRKPERPAAPAAPTVRAKPTSSRSTATSPPAGTIVLALAPYLGEVASFSDGRKVSLYVMDRHRPAIHKLVRDKGSFVPQGRGGAGAFATWADVIAQPSNKYDPDAVQVHVDGKPIAYFSMEWIDIAQQALRSSRGRKVVVPVTVRWSSERGEYVWAHGTIEDAQGLAHWLNREDHREQPQRAPEGE